MKTCPGCEKAYRAASTRAIVGGESRLVCPPCAKSAVKVVTARRDVRCPVCEGDAAVCAEKHHAALLKAKSDGKAILDPIAKGLLKRAEAYAGDDDYARGLREGLEMAHSVLRMMWL